MIVCPNKKELEGIVLRCQGCNSLHMVSNLGERDMNSGKILHLGRTHFDVTNCICDSPALFPLLHQCEIDDAIEIDFSPMFGPKTEQGVPKKIVYNEVACEIVFSWYRRLAQQHSLEITDAALSLMVERRYE